MALKKTIPGMNGRTQVLDRKVKHVGVAVISAKNYKRQRRKRQSVTPNEKSRKRQRS